VLDAAALSQAALESAQEKAPEFTPELTEKASLALYIGEALSSVLPITKITTCIGRALDNDIVIEDPRASRYHAQIAIRGGRVYLKDLQSSNGTLVNDEPIEEFVLVNGDLICIGDTELIFNLKST
jgi:pSer/pThr/pTyr-binding forkhead associated (FHA) protein